MNDQTRKMSENKETWSITELATEFDITPRTIRFYEDKGLLSPKREGQTRVYSRGDRHKLKLILRIKRLGFSLDHAQDLITLMFNPPLNSRALLETNGAKVGERITQLEEQARDIEITLAELRESKVLIDRLLSGEVVDLDETPFRGLKTGKVALVSDDKVSLVT